MEKTSTWSAVCSSDNNFGTVEAWMEQRKLSQSRKVKRLKGNVTISKFKDTIIHIKLDYPPPLTAEKMKDLRAMLSFLTQDAINFVPFQSHVYIICTAGICSTLRYT
jgi:hypothetical protein